MSSPWDDEQERLCKLVAKDDDYARPIKLLGGFDVTFVDSDSAVPPFSGIGALVVLSWPDMAIVYTDTVTMDTKVPYMPGYLGFRETPFAAELFKRLRSSRPELEPQVTLVDGCGIYHHRGCGSASQIGVELDICTVGVSKSFLFIDDMQEANYLQPEPLGSTTHSLLQGKSGQVWGAALYNKTSKHPLFVSIGHRVSLESAVLLVSASRIHRIPEPIRQADLLSRRIAINKRPGS
jgi:deoxyinosine 3'endonuclease (endonuclease V)